jgi:triacylglycerol lipase
MFDKTFALNVAYPAAVAAYQAMTLPLSGIGLPLGYSSTSFIESTDPTDRPYGVVGDGAFGKVIAIRGTETLNEWLDDFKAVLVPNPYGVGKVHIGFLDVYNRIRPSLLTVLRPLITAPVVIVGHSLGGALALLLAADLAPFSTVYTFASPRVGDTVFAAEFDSRSPNCVRIVNEGDVVPHVPLPPLFANVETPQTVRGGFRVGDISYAHHLDQYLAGLKKL